MRLQGVAQVVAFTADPLEAARWYAALLGVGPEAVHLEAGGFAWLEAGGVEMGFHPADADRNRPGGSPVVYWRVDDLDAARAELLASGCEPWRGPLQIEENRRICQCRDPFGTVIGLDGA